MNMRHHHKICRDRGMVPFLTRGRTVGYKHKGNSYWQAVVIGLILSIPFIVEIFKHG